MVPAAWSKAIPHPVVGKITTYRRVALSSLLNWCPLTPNLLEGNGDSELPDASERHSPWSKHVPNHSLLQSSFYGILVYWQLFWELFPPTPNAGYDPWPKFWIRQVTVPFPTPKQDYSPSSTWREPGFSKALQSTLTALILICCTSLSKKLDGMETSGNKQPSKIKIHPYRGEGAKESELIHPCGFQNSSIIPAICPVSLGSQMVECWIQFIGLFPRRASRCKKTPSNPKPNNPQNKTAQFHLLLQELRPLVSPNCNPLGSEL